MSVRARAVLRVMKAAIILTPLVFTFLRDKKRFLLVGRSRRLTEEQHRSRARRLTRVFERMGITYIKLAQFLTTRPDLVPPIYNEEFARLQDDVEPEPYGAVRSVLEAELGPVEEVFEFFEEEAISGASIAQVHHAKVDGNEVAVKVRRPGVEDRMEADLLVLGKVVPIVAWFLRRDGHYSHADSVQEITSELERTLHEEMNFIREKTIMEEIRENLEADGLMDEIIIPEPYPEYCTERVLTMSYEDGIKITEIDELEARGHDVEEIVDTIAEMYLRMAFVYKVYQADPHHGNLAVSEDGTPIIYDFGISERSKDHLVDAFVRFFTGLGMKDPRIALDALQDMGAIDPSMNQRTMLTVIEVLIKDISGATVTDTDIQKLEQRVDQTLYDYPLSLHQDIVLSMRTTFGVEGLTARVVPEYDFSEKLASFFIEEGLFDVDVEVDEEELLADDGAQIDGIKRDLEREIERNGKRAALSVFGGTAIVTGAVVATAGSSLALAGALGGIGGLSFFVVARSFRDRGEVAGPPAIATRYNMERWDDAPETASGEILADGS